MIIAHLCYFVSLQIERKATDGPEYKMTLGRVVELPELSTGPSHGAKGEQILKNLTEWMLSFVDNIFLLRHG